MTVTDVLKSQAKELIGDSYNVEYIRGICELIAVVAAREDVDTGTRATQIAEELGVSNYIIGLMY